MSLPAVILSQPADPGLLRFGPTRRPCCPRCRTASLTEVVRAGVVIDRCQRCHGVWLDDGELEQLLARARARG